MARCLETIQSSKAVQFVIQLTTNQSPSLATQANSLFKGNQNKTGIFDNGIHISKVSSDNTMNIQDGTGEVPIQNGIANQTNIISCDTTQNLNSFDTLSQTFPDNVIMDNKYKGQSWGFTSRSTARIINTSVQLNHERWRFHLTEFWDK